MSLTILQKLSVGSTLGGLLLLSVPASAHISMVGDIQARSNDDSDQKVKPCQGLERGAGEIYTFEPGAIIKLGVDETIGHDGYFRVAFDNDGEDGFVDPKSILPINPARENQGPTDQDKASDFCNVVSKDGGPTVLYDRLTPHVAGFLEGKEWSWNIKLPDVECDNCTLQVMQVMEDPPGHGPFDGKGDLYYRCVDIVLKKGAGKTKGTVDGPLTTEGMQCTVAGQEPPPGTGPVTQADASVPTTPPAKADAGVSADAGKAPTKPTEPDEPAEHDDEHEDTDHEESASTASDAGKPAGKPDAGKRDAGKTTTDDDDEKPVAAASDEGCSVAAATNGNGSGTALGLLFAFAGMAVRSRRRKTS